MGGQGTQTSPWSERFSDYQNNALIVTVNFNQNNRNILDAVITREPGCVYSKLFIGLGPDSKPNSSPMTFEVPEGVTQITAAQMQGVGLNKIEEILALQITAGA
jgi:hypothetical protein